MEKIMNVNILTEDLEVLSSLPFIKFKKLKNKTFLITGATGLIGFNLINALVFISRKYDLNIGIYCVVRNYEKAKHLFSAEVMTYEGIVFFDVDIDTAIGLVHTQINYIIHLASPTSSKTFVEIPVEIIDFAYSTTKKLLEVARDQKSKFIYFSSMEVYGTPSDDRKISEDYTDNAPLTMSARSSYCEAKRLCETLCKAYYEEYNVPIFVLRLTQTFGPGVNIEKDNRIFAQFAKSTVNKTDILLKTKGETKRSYLYTMDAVSALLTIMLHGKSGEAYNIANEATYCSIFEMANLVCDKIAKGSIKIKFEMNKDENQIYLPTLHMNLDTSKLQKLKWYPTRNLEEMFCRMIEA